MLRTRSRHHGTVAGAHVALSPDQQVEGRRRRSRTPLVLSVLGFVLGTVVADATILFLLGDSLLATAWPDGALTEPAAWVSALSALRDPGLALASVVLGGIPGAVVGRGAAVRRSRSDRLDALVSGNAWR